MEYAIQFTGWMAFFILLLTFLFATEQRTKRICGWISVVLAVGLSLLAAYPPTDRELLPVVESHARGKDKDFEDALGRARERVAAGVSEFVALQEAINNHPTVTAQGTPTVAPLNFRKYFPDIKIRDEEGRLTNTASFNNALLLQLQRKAAGKIPLGLDLKGGSSFLLEVQSEPDKPVDSVAMEEAKTVMMRRVDALGLAEPIVQVVGENRILIQMPGASEAERQRAKDIVQRPAYLEFRLVHPQNHIESAKAKQDETHQVPGYKKFYGWGKDQNGNRVREIYFLESIPRLSGKIVKSARPDFDDRRRYMVRFELHPEATEQFARLTEEFHARDGVPGRNLAIVLDGEVQSAPTIRSPITTGSGVIEGDFSLDEVKKLSMVLTNPLDKPVKFIEERNVDASLGADSIRSGITAGIIGATAVIIFMASYYLLTGVIANIAVVLNVVILIGVMALFPFTLTLPGIAGIVLTIGMAVDANVLINERIREELLAGKPLRLAIAAGYGKAFWTIFDSNVTTLMTATILIFLGSGPVKGFGITLAIGLLVNMFTAIVFTRLLLDFLVERGWVKNLKMLHVIRGTNIDFLKYRKPAAALSAIVVLVGVVWFIQRRGIEGIMPSGAVGDAIVGAIHKVIPMRGVDIYGIDFRGGEAVTLDFEKRQDEDAIRRALESAGYTDLFLQHQRELTTGHETLQVKTPLAEGERQLPPVTEVLQKGFPDAKYKEISRETVGSTVSSELKGEAFLAIAVACVLILIYIALRFEFGFGLSAVVALLHDVLVTVGFFAISGRQFSLPMVAAILTIIGFSINDTIVIFDRIREDMKLHGGRMTMRQVINSAINQTLSRTIITSVTVLLATLALFIWGGGVINDFAFTFLVGIITGTYSSVFIASPVVLWWHNRQAGAAREVAEVLPQPESQQRA